MRSNTIKNSVLVFLVLLCNIGLAADQIISTTGMVNRAKTLYHQYKFSIPYLRLAAETGDAESQFYLAEVLSGLSGLMGQEALYWYEKSAEQGDLYAMYRLANRETKFCEIAKNCPLSNRAPSDWNRMLIETATLKSTKGDSKAMAIMYKVTGSIHWLEKSASSGNAEAQWLLASRYLEGYGIFWPSQRQKEVERLLKLSADNGYPKSMLEYAGLLVEKGRANESISYILKAVDMSYVYAIANYAYHLKYDTPYNVCNDPVKSYALYSLLLKLDGGESLNDDATYEMKGLKNMLTPKEQSQALLYAEDWEVNHPPLSFYPTKLGK